MSDDGGEARAARGATASSPVSDNGGEARAARGATASSPVSDDGGAATDFDAIQIGDRIPEFTRTTGFVEWNRYAAVNDEFIPIHMDDEAGRAAGNERGAFGMGNLRLAYLTNMLRAWIGVDGEIRSLSAKYRSMNQKGDELRATGEVTAKEVVDGVALVHLAVDVVDQDGTSTTPGKATVAFPLR